MEKEKNDSEEYVARPTPTLDGYAETHLRALERTLDPNDPADHPTLQAVKRKLAALPEE